MDVRNCKSCGKLYNYFGGQPYCPSCLEEIDMKFKEVKEYLYDHPNTDMYEISKIFDISVTVIQRWIREERLSYADNSLIGISCEQCGVTIKTGRYCKTCRERLANNLSSAYGQPGFKKEDSSQKLAQMRFLK